MILQLKRLLVLFIPLLTFSLQAQDSIQYGAPVKWPIKLSGTFGELRPGHFHMGIDIKSPNGGVGHPIQSIADGYVSRIKVSSGGYGKVLYIIHPSGHESVYAHLQLFLPEIEAYVKAEQYSKSSYEVDLKIFPDQFVVKKGQVIGRMGMTGRTFGPHLHFELRDKWTGLGLNPLAYGIKVDDKRAPSLYQVIIYELDHNGYTIGKKKYDAKSLPPSLPAYADQIAIGIKAYDRMDGVPNLNGVHSIMLSVDGQNKFGFDCDTLNHSKQRYINAHKDFELFQEEAAYVNRMYKLKGNQLDIYNGRDGIINLVHGQTKTVQVIIEDSFDNQKEIKFQIIRKDRKKEIPYPVFNHIIQSDSSSNFNLGELSLKFKPGNVYEDTPVKITTIIDDSTGVKIYRVHHRNDPVHLPYQLSLYLPEIADSLRSKYYIAGLSSKGDPANLGGHWKGDTLSTRLYGFGDFSVALDTIPPKIKAKSFKKDLSKAFQMSFTIKDEYPRAYLKYDAYVDGEWLLMEYDAKKDRLTHVFDGRIGPGEHELALQVEDRQGNVSVRKFSFQR